MSLEYNTERDGVVLKEYGRNIQKLVAYVKGMEEGEKRSQYAKTLTDLMRQINTALKDNPEYDQKVWDDLHIISDFELNVESPFPMPEKELLGKKPQRLAYKSSDVKYRHYGRNIETMIKQAIAMEDPESKENAVIHIGRLMNSFYTSVNKDNLDEEVILKQIKQMSQGQLDIDLEKVKEGGLFNSTFKERRGGGGHGGHSGHDRNHGHQNKRRNYSKRRRS
jgi:hypothetical protein